MKWIKKGLIFSPNGSIEWMNSHSYIPTPFILNKNIIRIFVAFWDKHKVGRIGFIDVDAECPKKIIKVSPYPVLDIGDNGTFDDNGVAPSSIIEEEDHLKLYYFGFQKGYKIRYFLFGGLALSFDRGNSFFRYQKTPIIDRINDEYFLRSAPFILKEDGLYKMWYTSGTHWIEVNNKSVPVYNIRYLESFDGKDWKGKGKLCIDLKLGEHGLGRPWIIKYNSKYRMFYSIRYKSINYRLGYAESYDGINWIRKDEEIGIDVSSNGWDSEMICFPSVIKYKDRFYMFYNGNNYGETGFGYAILDKW